MKIALVYEDNGTTPAMKDDQHQVVFPVFRWYSFQRGEYGWELHLLAFCRASTRNFRFQAFQGVFACGRGKRGVWLEFCPNERVYHIGGPNA